jgi:acyl-CoA thioester hydrolase
VSAQQVWRGETLLAEGRIRIGCVQCASLKPCRIPKAVLQALVNFTEPQHTG